LHTPLGVELSKIAVIGTGYVGLTTSIGMASLGHDVIGYDIDSAKVDMLKAGKLPIHEPGLDVILDAVLKSGNLQATSDLALAVSEADFIFTCVPTPQDEDGSADLSYVIAASKAMKSLLKTGAVVVTKSTVPVGSAQRVEAAIDRDDIHVASNPEFLREGAAVHDFEHPDRIVVGARTNEVAQSVMDLYSKVDCPKVLTSQPAAELIKYASNSFLAIKLSFVNDVAALCEAAGADPREVMHGMGLDTRIGNRFLEPGPGWGGSCFPKDTRALASIADSFGLQIPLINAAIASNETAHKRVADRVMNALGGSLVGKTIAVLGLTFKADTDDTRESPAISVIERLVGRGGKVVAYDPMVTKYDLAGMNLADSAVAAASGAHALLVLTEWAEFKSIDAKEILSAMSGKIVVDTRNVFNQKTWEAAGATFPNTASSRTD
jgi:UDPglucose 6-dehydrogenase